MGVARLAIAVTAALLIAAPSLETAQSSDPAQNLSRVRLVVTSTASTTDLTVAGVDLASYVSSIISAPPGSRSTQLGQTMRLSNAGAGQQAEARFDAILAGVTSAQAITWNLATSGGEAQLEVYSLASFDSPKLVDRFTTDQPSAQFQTAGSLLDSHGSLQVSPIPHLVLAHYYPWYSLQDWLDPQMIDNPSSVYSSDDVAAVTRQEREARSAGIDAFVVSWQGKDVSGGVNDRRMRLVLDAAKQTGIQACVYTETLVANPGHDPAQPVDPGTLLTWFEQIVDLYGSAPMYLRVNGRPVIFVYQSWQLTVDQWNELRARLRTTGRDPLLIGDFFHSGLLDFFDGEYQYSNVTQTPESLHAMYRVETLRVRTFHLLRPGDRRRLWIASVAPGYNDTQLASRATHLVVDRAAGSLYEQQWSEVLNTAADWAIVTSWNEWWENTEIEPGRLYGLRYLDLTRVRAYSFKGLALRRRP